MFTQFKSKLFGAINLVILVMFCLITLAFGNRPIAKSTNIQKRPSEVVKKFWALSEKGDIESASKYMTNLMPITTTQGTRYVSSNSPFDQEAKFIFESKQKFLKVVSEQIKNNKAEVIAEIDNGNGNISKQQHNMCKIKGEWKILTIYSAYPRRTPFIDK